MSDFQEPTPQKKYIPELPLSEGNQTLETIANFIDENILQLDGKPIGIITRYKESSGNITVANGHEVTYDKQLPLIFDATKGPPDTDAPEYILARPIETEVVRLNDDYVAEVSTQPAHDLFGGEVQPGIPLYTADIENFKASILIPTLSTNTKTETLGNQTTSTNETVVKLHNPLTRNLKPDPSFDPTVVETITPREYEHVDSLRLITKITRTSKT